MTSAIGIDIGGTKISLALGLTSGRILAVREIPTQTGARTRLSVSRMIEEIQSLLDLVRRKKLKVSGIGIGLPGPVDAEKGTVPRSPNLSGWKDLPLRRILQQKFRLPVELANDANAAAVGEHLFGRAKNTRDFIYLTVSTGIGGGVFVHGKLMVGASCAAGEVGHIVVVPEGEKCRCGNRGCLEAYASGTAMASYAKKKMKKGRKSILKKRLKPGETITARLLGQAAQQGDKLALKTYSRSAYYLGIGVAALLNSFNPEKIILGGGVFKSAPKIFWSEMIQSARAHAWPEAYQGTSIELSKLNTHVGLLGALALIFQSCRKYLTGSE